MNSAEREVEVPYDIWPMIFTGARFAGNYVNKNGYVTHIFVAEFLLFAVHSL